MTLRRKGSYAKTYSGGVKGKGGGEGGGLYISLANVFLLHQYGRPYIFGPIGNTMISEMLVTKSIKLSMNICGCWLLVIIIII